LAGQLELRPTRFALRALIEERIVWAAPQLEAEHMRTVTHIAPDLTVMADRDRIGQVVTALIDNAVRYAAAGRVIEFEADVENEGRSSMLSLCVRDRGPGIPPEHLPRIFDRFWRAEQSRGRGSGGSGLGLAIASAICEAHQGFILAANRPAGGTEFHLSIPLNGADTL
jgi:signal transduction histidine kinase